MTFDQRQIRTHRALLLGGAAAYLCWWGFVHVALPHAFNPLGSRLAVVGCFVAVYAASHTSAAVARHLDAWLTACGITATAHYFYLFAHNGGDLNWVVGAYITVTAVCAILQTSASVLVYSLAVVAMSVGFLMLQPVTSYEVFLPGLFTNLIFANVGLRARFKLLERLRESHQRIESLFDAGFDGIAVHEGGTIHQVNGALETLLGYPKADLMGQPLSKLFGPRALEVVQELETQANGAPREVDVRKKDGSHVAVEVLAKGHVLDGRQVWLVALRDLTERKRAELGLLRANRGLESFSYSVAHDLRAPLRAIDGFSQILRDDHAQKLDDEGKRLLDRIGAAAQTMGQLIDGLLDLSRLSRNELRREPVDLSAIAEAAASQLKAAQPDRAVEVSIQPGLFAYGDSRLLRTALDNLLGNAWKFTQRQTAPRIEFSARLDDERPVYFVKDNGAGFDMAYADKLFGAFQRLHSSSDFPGTGIGLATVQRIVESHGGHVWAEAAVGEGATLFFTLNAGAR